MQGTASPLQGAGVAHPLRKDARPFPSASRGREELREAVVPLLPSPSTPAAESQYPCCHAPVPEHLQLPSPAGAWLLGHKVTDGCFSMLMGLMATQDILDQPSGMAAARRPPLVPSIAPRAALLEGSPPAPCSPSPVGTQPPSPAGKVTCRSGQSQS